MKATFIITEKRKVSEAIARALAPETFDDYGNSSALHNDIVAVRRLNRGEVVDNSGDYYFNGVTNLPYEIRAEHLDHMGHKSARRVRRKMKYINEHIVSDLEAPVLRILGSANTIDDVCAVIEQGDYPQKDVLDEQTESLSDAVARTLRMLENQGKVKADKDKYILTTLGQRAAHGMQRELFVPEDINYFIFERGGSLVIILDTYGTPLRYRRKAGKDYLQKLVLESKDWNELGSMLKLEPGFQTSDLRDLKSHVVRMLLFNHILTKRRLPCDYNRLKAGQRIELENVVAATDFDIAGSWIFSSVIEYANEYARGKGLEPVEPGMLRRLDMRSMEPAELQLAFGNLLKFDWNNAYAGKARSVFDFLYGTSISDQLRHFNRSPARLSVGRTLFLSLKKLIKEEENIRAEKEQNFGYLAFNGLLDLNQIKEAISRKDYVLMHVRRKRNYVSHSKFLELCREDDIGTHTTRYKLADRLEEMRTISIVDNRLLSTSFGNVYYNVLAGFIDSSPVFNISQWNRDLHGIIDYWSNACQDSTMGNMEDEFHKFMRVFLPSLQRHFKYLNREIYVKITNQLAAAYQGQGRIHVSPAAHHREYDAPEGAFLLTGANSILSIQDIIELIDPSTNTPRPGARSRIVRVMPQEPVSLVDDVRRTFNISRDYDFTVISSYNSEMFFRMRNENYTVFRAEMPEGAGLKDIISGGIRLDDYVECELDESNFEAEDELTAHDSLMLKDIRRSDIAGREGLWLAEEYHKPWYHTYDKMRKKAAGLVNVAGFRSGAHEFERIERYKYGFVHNFESLLVAMLEKYNMPFWRTAKLAEEMYLNAG